MVAGRHLKKHINRHNSSALHQIWGGGRYGSAATCDYVKFHFRKKSKMAAAAILKIHFNGHNSVTIEDIHTKFGSET